MSYYEDPRATVAEWEEDEMEPTRCPECGVDSQPFASLSADGYGRIVAEWTCQHCDADVQTDVIRETE